MEAEKTSKGKLIVIEGVDSSGKQTQTMRAYEYFKALGKEILKISFPDYDSDFSMPIKRYLAGDLGGNPEDVSPYAASAFYAIDRYASYKTKWGRFYEDGGIIISDRYVTSNLVHQASKVSGQEKSEFINWLRDFEYNRLALPVPDLVLFLDMPVKFAFQLMGSRNNKITGDSKKDIHEGNVSYLEKSYVSALQVAKECGWKTIGCAENDCLLSVEDIHKKIIKEIENVI